MLRFRRQSAESPAQCRSSWSSAVRSGPPCSHKRSSSFARLSSDFASAASRRAGPSLPQRSHGGDDFDLRPRRGHGRAGLLPTVRQRLLEASTALRRAGHDPPGAATRPTTERFHRARESRPMFDESPRQLGFVERALGKLSQSRDQFRCPRLLVVRQAGSLEQSRSGQLLQWHGKVRQEITRARADRIPDVRSTRPAIRSSIARSADRRQPRPICPQLRLGKFLASGQLAMQLGKSVGRQPSARRAFDRQASWASANK